MTSLADLNELNPIFHATVSLPTVLAVTAALTLPIWWRYLPATAFRRPKFAELAPPPEPAKPPKAD